MGDAVRETENAKLDNRSRGEAKPAFAFPISRPASSKKVLHNVES